MSLFAILALGFFLGLRHATDSDHVIAVTTIVSLISVAFGLFLAYRIGIADRLFLGAAQWIPR